MSEPHTPAGSTPSAELEEGSSNCGSGLRERTRETVS